MVPLLWKKKTRILRFFAFLYALRSAEKGGAAQVRSHKGRFFFAGTPETRQKQKGAVSLRIQ